jgi:hypothetical protein
MTRASDWQSSAGWSGSREKEEISSSPREYGTRGSFAAVANGGGNTIDEDLQQKVKSGSFCPPCLTPATRASSITMVACEERLNIKG